MRIIFCHLLLTLLACTAVADSAPAKSTTDRPPNIVFILADDLGVYDLHCYGRADHHTPNLDRLAAQGKRFTTAFCAQPICSPSRAAILTGKTPARLHLTTYLPGRQDLPSQLVLHPVIEKQVPLTEKMWPHYFKAAGYASIAIGKWHVGGKGFGPLDFGFDAEHPGKANTPPSASEGGKGEFELTAAAETFMEANKERPFVVYLAHNTPHIHYSASPERIAANAQAFEPVYAAVIESLDASVGRLLTKIDTLGIADRTIVIFTSDNGGLHVPEGDHQRVTHNGPFRAGKGYGYEGGLRIPLIVRWPNHVPAGVVTDTAMVNTDWLPTLLELTGQPAPTGLDGTSIAGLLTAGQATTERSFYWHFPHYTNQGGRPCGVIRTGQWKLIEYFDDQSVELYDLAADTGETTNLAAANPERVGKMRAELAAWRTRNNAQSNSPNPGCNPQAFRSLYVDFDPSRFAPTTARPDQWQAVQAWRKGMDAPDKGR